MQHRVPPDRLPFLSSGKAGLDSEAAAEALRHFGNNDIVGAATSGWSAIVLDTIRDPMLWFLLATAALFQWLGDHAEAMVLAAALLPILGMDAWLHWRTQASTASLASRLDPHARVLRDRRWIEVAATSVAPGDLLEVRPGDHAAADGVVVQAENVQLDESALTGESMPVRKHALCGVPEDDRVDDEHWIAAGTRMLAGTAHVRVLLTGKDTLYGEIARLTKTGGVERTPLQRSLDRLVGRLVIAAAALCLLLAGVRLGQGHGAVDALVSGATLAVAALPEEFPVAFAFFLGVGVYRLARRQALVRRAAVVENIGRVTCLCTDKTGTLTVGELRLVALLASDDSNEESLIAAAVAASRQDSGDPLDQAIFAYQARAMAPARLSPASACMADFPFTEQRRREVAVLRDAGGRHLAFAKGAPETIFELCDMSVEMRGRWRDVLVQQAKEARKVIACATREITGWDGSEPSCGFALVGLLAFEDPLRPEARETVASVAAAGLRLIMLTGDHAATASAIAGRSGLGATPPRLIEGEALEAALREDPRLRSVDVVARCLPTQKLALVQSLRGAGEIVAVTGDGVNDAPALSAADVGISMGQRGTRSAREAASIVLLDDDLRSLVRAIAEGRQLFRNLQSAFAYLLLVHIPLVLTAALVPMFGLPLVLLPIHIVWLELVIHPTLLLVFQELPQSSGCEARVATQTARFFSNSQATTIGIGGAVLTAIVAGAYVAALHETSDAAEARTFALSALLAVSAGVTAGLTSLRTRASRAAVATTLLTTAIAVSTPAIASTLSLGVAGLGVIATSLVAAVSSALIASRVRQP